MLIIYLRGQCSARSQAVLCVKTFSSLRALGRPRESKKWGFKTAKMTLVVNHTRLSIEEGDKKKTNSRASHTIVIVMVREGSTDHQVILAELIIQAG